MWVRVLLASCASALLLLSACGDDAPFELGTAAGGAGGSAGAVSGGGGSAGTVSGGGSGGSGGTVFDSGVDGSAGSGGIDSGSGGQPQEAGALCTDKVQNGDETDIDCGGSCPKCTPGKGCKSPSDCGSGVCTNLSTCAAATCNDKVQNGSETDVDCGGTCPSCKLLLNFDGMGAAGAPPSPKIGPAAFGLTPNDFWNAVGQPQGSPFPPNWTISGLKWSDGTPSGVKVDAANLNGAWGWTPPPANGDKMYESYSYSWNGGSASLTLTGLPSGSYVVYAYGHENAPSSNSGYWASTHMVSNGPAVAMTPTKYTDATGGSFNSTTWVDGGQYVLLAPIQLNTGELLRINIEHGTQGTGNAGCLWNGLQIVRQ